MSLAAFMMATTRAGRSAAFLRMAAQHTRAGTYVTWDIPNTLASTFEDIAAYLESAEIRDERLYWAKAVALVSDRLASDSLAQIEDKRDKLVAVLRNAAYRTGGPEALDGAPVPPECIHDICHNLHGSVDARAFADACAAEQRRLYGVAPDADR